jgi:arylsulfatase
MGRTNQLWALRGDPNPLSLTLEGKGPAVPYGRAEVRFLEGLYDGEIAFFDAQLGLLLDELRQRRLLERTIVVVMADHGESFLEHGSVKHCRTVFEPEVRTPLLVRLPRQHHGARLAGAVQNLDLVPTLLDLLGLPVPGQGFEGRSLLPRLNGAPPGGELAFTMINNRRAVADNRYKLLADLRSGSWQLFDLQSDPAERRDVKETTREPFDRLRRELRAWLAAEGPQGLQESEEADRQLRALGYL